MKIRQLVFLISRIRKRIQAATNRLQAYSSITSFVLDEEDDDQQVLLRFGYTVREKLGEGSFSYVTRAHSKRHGRDVAIKIIKLDQVPKLYMEKFLPREIELVKIVNHENIVKFLNVTQTRSFIYIIMNLAVNGNLLETISENTYIDEKRACRWFHHLVGGIAFCHGIGIAHRDLKCENLLLDERNVLKISDFSFARGILPLSLKDNEEDLDTDTELSSTFCGSHAYACPEILLRRPYKPHLADIWSMGIILFAMLSGRLPFDDANLYLLLQDIQRPVRFPKFPVLSEDVKLLILKILSPSSIRIYIPMIKKDSWYVSMFKENHERSLNVSNYFRSFLHLQQ